MISQYINHKYDAEEFMYQGFLAKKKSLEIVGICICKVEEYIKISLYGARKYLRNYAQDFNPTLEFKDI